MSLIPLRVQFLHKCTATIINKRSLISSDYCFLQYGIEDYVVIAGIHYAKRNQNLAKQQGALVWDTWGESPPTHKIVKMFKRSQFRTKYEKFRNYPEDNGGDVVVLIVEPSFNFKSTMIQPVDLNFGSRGPTGLSDR